MEYTRLVVRLKCDLRSCQCQPLVYDLKNMSECRLSNAIERRKKKKWKRNIFKTIYLSFFNKTVTRTTSISLKSPT